MNSIETFKNHNVLVTGGTGMIGRPLVRKLLNEGAILTIASIDKPNIDDELLKHAKFIYADLRNLEDCKKVVSGNEIVFHLAGIKGSPKLTQSQPATFFTNTMMFNLNMMEAARSDGVQRYLFTSSVGVYAPASLLREEDVWKTFPSENDKFAGYAKRMGELQAQAYSIEHNWNAVYIARPANVYGPYDNFDPLTGMVIPSLISRFTSEENPVKIWGDGSAVRDFIYSEDVANGMIRLVKSNFLEPVNFGSGKGTSILEVVQILNSLFPEKQVLWDAQSPKGDDTRILETIRARNLGIFPKVNLIDGISKVVNWYQNNKNFISTKYNAFNEYKQVND